MAYPVMLISHDPQVILEQIRATEARLRYLRKRVAEIRTLMENSNMAHQINAAQSSIPEISEFTQKTPSPKGHILTIAYRNEF